MGIRSAACTEYQWPYYGDLVGARFAGHPALQPGTVLVEDQSHPAMALRLPKSPSTQFRRHVGIRGGLRRGGLFGVRRGGRSVQG
ncbi:ThuA domain-containing protein [Streptomyces sp. NPDC055955]|uniref:ThuA domain-containing protein n=1 Tax=Streptomyces sp. NPDC055955 TaxID=3345665 RepID=UPI0035D90BF9